jgi:hypothetical protein
VNLEGAPRRHDSRRWWQEWGAEVAPPIAAVMDQWSGGGPMLDPQLSGVGGTSEHRRRVSVGAAMISDGSGK